MNTFSKLGLCALGALVSSIAGCSTTRSSEAPAASNLDGMTPAARTRSAAEQISGARCEREQQCGNIGNDKTYSSFQDCGARIANDWKDDLNARQCPGGINQHELSECLEQIHAEACANPFDTLARMTECTSGQICIEQP